MGKLKPAKYFWIIAVLVLAIVLAVGILHWSNGRDENSISPTKVVKVEKCSAVYKKDKAVYINGLKIEAELARTSAELEKGLGGRECINANQGMLFVFDKPGKYSFWMRDMKFPIDMVWINQAKKVVKVQPDVSPETYPDTFTNDLPALYVLELKANAASTLAIKPGTEVKF